MRARSLTLGLVLVVTAACAGGGTPVGTSDIVASIRFEPGEQLAYTLVGDADVLVGVGMLSVTVGDAGELVLVQRYEGVSAGLTSQPATDAITVLVDAGTLKPQQGSRRIAPRADEGDEAAVEAHSWRYLRGEDRDTLVAARGGDGAGDERELRLAEHYYDNESSLWLWRTLDLSDGYEARYVSVNPTDRNQQTVVLRVVDRQTVEVPAGVFETWRLQVRSGRATRIAWIEVAPPHRVVQWDNGAIVFQLAEVGRVED